MLKSIIVDDKQLEIERLEKRLKTSGAVKVIGTYTNGHQALEAIKKCKPDIVFLDVLMPEMSGIELTKKIIKNNKNSRIVFVTDHKDYAIEAFEVGATDYVLKPYTEERIHQVVHRFSHLFTPKINQENFMIHAFKYFHITKNGEEIKNIKWKTAKSRELFAYLLHHNKELVRKDVLIDLLWEDIEIDKAYDSLYTSIYQMRKTLEEVGIGVEIIRTTNSYGINLKDIKYDVYEWLDLIDQLHSLILESDDIKRVMALYNRALKLYKGHYLEEESYLWKENLKEQHRIVFLTMSKNIIKFFDDHGQYTEAILVSLQIQKKYPYHDFPYFALMQLYDKIGDWYNVKVQYKALEEMLESEIDMLPSLEIRKWFQEWFKEKQIG